MRGVVLAAICFAAAACSAPQASGGGRSDRGDSVALDGSAAHESGETACDRCADTALARACAVQQNSCDRDPACVALGACLDGCANDACAGGCYGAAPPSAAAELDALDGCVCATCAAACASECR